MISSAGRAFPVDVIYRPVRLKTRSMIDPVVAVIHEALAEQSGSLLIFLPGGLEKFVASKISCVGKLPNMF